jgi:CheY-like chemotaxis protein
MVIDTDQVFVSLISDILSDEGYDPFTWVDGSTAYQTAKARQPSLIVLDINVTNADAGLKVLDTLTLDPETVLIPVIVTTTNPEATFADVDRLAVHRRYLLHKPFDLPELLDMVRQALPLSSGE